MKKGKPVLQNRCISPGMRTIRLVICVMAIAIILFVFVLFPIWNMSDLQLWFTVDEWAMVITGFICIQILMLSMYREIKYGGYR